MPAKLKHTDHSRQFQIWVAKAVEVAKRDPRNVVERGEITTLIEQGTKFLLPGNGILLDDPYLKGIDDKMRLNIPFPVTVIEFPDPWGDLAKTIITLQESDYVIKMFVTIFHLKHQKWGTMSPVIFSRDNYIQRNSSGQPDFTYSFEPQTPEEVKMNHQLYHPYIVVVLQLLNALSCKNVSHEKSTPGAVRLGRKGPIPYDSYRILTTFINRPPSTGGGGSGKSGVGARVGAVHASPREHLRRGHIVRQPNGRVYWRNAHIVMPGNGGTITKSYALR
jgi:hypothetical protein